MIFCTVAVWYHHSHKVLLPTVKYSRKDFLKTHIVEWNNNASYTYLHLWGKKQGFCFSSRRTNLAWHSRVKSDKHTLIYTNTETQKCSKKGKRWRKKNLDRCCGLCVGTGEWFVLQNSHYQHSAAGLQLARAEGSVAWPNERLISLPFFVKTQIWWASTCWNSYCFHSTFPMFICFCRK